MAVQFRAMTAPVLANVATIDVTKPAGTTDRDLMLLYAMTSQASAVQFLPDDDRWQVLPMAELNGDDNITIWALEAEAGEAASYMIRLDATSSAAAGIVTLYSDTGQRLKIDDVAAQFNAVASATRTWPSVTTTAANAFLALFGSFSASGTNTPGGGLTERWDTGPTPRAYLQTQIVASPGATGTKTATGGSGTSKCISIAVIEGTPATYGGPRFRGAAHVGPVGGTTPQDVSAPADLEVGDLMVLEICYEDDRTPIITPDNWTPIDSIPASGGIRLYQREATAADLGAVWNIAFVGTSATLAAQIAAFYSPTGQRVVIDAHTKQSNSPAITTAIFPSVTPTAAPALYVGFYASPDTTVLGTGPGGRFWKRSAFGASGVSMGVLTEQLLATGATGTRAGTWATGSRTSYTITLALIERPRGLAFDGVDLLPHLAAWSIESVMRVAPATTLASDAEEKIPIIPDWKFECNGLWSVAIDNLFGGAVASNQAANKALTVVVGREGDQVVYSTLTAFVASYRHQIPNVDNLQLFSATIAISGAPQRSA